MMLKTISAWILRGLVLVLAVGVGVPAVANPPCGAAAPQNQDENGAQLGQAETQSYCMAQPHEGRVALVLAQGDAIANKAPRWGFLNAKGELAIEPRFEAVDNFYHGLAAAREQGKWGYIDRDGGWVITPRFDRAAAFTETGLASVSAGNKQFLIGRDGQQAGQPFDRDIESVVLGEGVPSGATLFRRRYYVSLEGKRTEAPADVELTGKPFGVAGMRQAVRPGERSIGIVDSELNWKVEPRYRLIDESPQKAGLAIGVRPDGHLELITPDARILPGSYKSNRRIGATFTFAYPHSKTELVDVFDARGRQVAHVASASVTWPEWKQGIAAVYGKDYTLFFIAGSAEPVRVDGKIKNFLKHDNFLLLQDSGRRAMALVTPTGQVLSVGALGRWPRKFSHLQTSNDRLWVFRDGYVFQIVDSAGAPLLTDATRMALLRYSIEKVERRDGESALGPDWPLALLQEQTEGHHERQGGGLLRADGTLVRDPSWKSVTSAEAGDKPFPERAIDWRLLVSTDSGWGMIDIEGRVLLPAEYQHIDKFDGAYALAKRDGVFQVIDRNGTVHPLPGITDAELVAPSLVRYRENSGDEGPWGLFDFVAQRIVLAPGLARIGRFQGGFADATTVDGKQGVIDPAGRWTIPASAATVIRRADQLWQVYKPASDEAGSAFGSSAIIHGSGREVIGLHPGLHTEEFPGGIRVATEDRAWHVKADGTVVAGAHFAKITHFNDLMLVEEHPRHGYVDKNGAFLIGPVVGTGSPFHQVEGRALLKRPDGAVLIDSTGTVRATLPEGAWEWPLGTEWLIGHEFSEDESIPIVSRFANAQGQIMLTLQGAASPFKDGRAAFASGNVVQSAMWIDRTGSPLMDARFDGVGLLHEGLAIARENDKYGFVDASGKFVIQPIYDSLMNFDGGAAVARAGGELMLINVQGKTLAKISAKCGIGVLTNAEGRRAWPRELPSDCVEK